MKTKVNLKTKEASSKKETINTAIVVKSLEKQAKPLIDKLGKLDKIKTQEDYKKAGELLKQLKEIGKIALVEEEKFTIPLKGLLKTTQEHFKPFKDNQVLVETNIKSAMLLYVAARDAKVEKLEQDFDAGKIKKIDTYLKKSQSILSSNEYVQERKKTIVVITSMEKIPLKYLEPNLKLIKEALEAGKEVPGAKLDQEVVLAI